MSSGNQVCFCQGMKRFVWIPSKKHFSFKRTRLNCLSEDLSSEGVARRVDGRVEPQWWEQRSYSHSQKVLCWASQNFCTDRKFIRGFKDVRGANLSTRPREPKENPQSLNNAKRKRTTHRQLSNSHLKNDDRDSSTEKEGALKGAPLPRELLEADGHCGRGSDMAAEVWALEGCALTPMQTLGPLMD